jgi:hypothetical protein
MDFGAQRYIGLAGGRAPERFLGTAHDTVHVDQFLDRSFR